MYILNFEDDVYKQNDIANAVRRGGIGNVQIDCVRNLEDGISRIREQITSQKPYDLIITDMWYPEKSGMKDEMSGERLIRLVEENEWNIPIILCSSVRYRIPEILGVVHYSKTSDWEMDIVKIIKKLT